MAGITYILLCFVLYCSGLRTRDPVIRKLDPDDRYQYMESPDGSPHLVDLWLKLSDVAEAAKFLPDKKNVYHLFTRANPRVSQPLMFDSEQLIRQTNFDPDRRIIVLLHGWMSSVMSDMISNLVPALLTAEDVNVIAVDWSAGADTINYATAVTNTLTSGESVARFINWLNRATGATPAQYHLIGHSLGAHQAGIVGRNVEGTIPYITGLDPASPGWIINTDRFRHDDGTYTEVIHTNAGHLGFLSTLGDVDFYPNGGVDMPGCGSLTCDHSRSYYYLAESITRGGFIGTRCSSFVAAMTDNCFLWGSLRMGGLVPKTGCSGVFYLETNAAPPFSRSF